MKPSNTWCIRHPFASIAVFCTSLLLIACATASSTAPTPSPTRHIGATATPLLVPFTPPSAASTVEARLTASPPSATRPPATPVPTVAAGAAVTLAQAQLVFTNFCTGCHPDQQGMDLTAGASLRSLVNVPSREVPSVMRVLPGNPDSSYLYQKISQDKPRVGKQMPLNGDPLTPAEQSVIREWIRQGAKGS